MALAAMGGCLVTMAALLAVEVAVQVAPQEVRRITVLAAKFATPIPQAQPIH